MGKIKNAIKAVAEAVGVATKTAAEAAGKPVAEVVQQANEKLVKGGTLGDPRLEQRIAPHHRIICGMGSGGPEDVNTYAMVDRMSQEERDALRAKAKGTLKELPISAQMDPGPGEEERGVVPVSESAIADIMDRHYVRDPKTQHLRLKCGTCNGDGEIMYAGGHGQCIRCNGTGIDPGETAERKG